MQILLALLLAVVNATNSSVSYACQVTTAAVTYPYLSQSDLVVTSTTGPGVVTTLVLTTDYTLNVSSTTSTGVLTLLNPAGTCPAGSTLKIVRTVPLTQPTSFRSQGAFYPALHETAYDRLEMQIQQLNNGVALPTILFGNPVNIGTANAQGTSANSSRADHVHGGGVLLAPTGAQVVTGFGNVPAVTLNGTGTGTGVTATGGANGVGVSGVGGATVGDGVQGTATNGNGGTFTGGGGGGNGVSGTGQNSGGYFTGTGPSGYGAVAYGSATNPGLYGVGGATGVGVLGNGGSTGAGGSGGSFTGNGTAGRGVIGQGSGTGAGVIGTGGATGNGVVATAGGTVAAPLLITPLAATPTAVTEGSLAALAGTSHILAYSGGVNYEIIPMRYNNGGASSNRYQTVRTNGCGTAAAVGATCITTVTWPYTYADTNYTVVCMGSLPSNVPLLFGATLKAAGSVQVTTYALTANIAQFSQIECYAIHD